MSFVIFRYLDPIAQRRVNKTVYDELGRFFRVEIRLLYCLLRLYLQHLPLKHKKRQRRWLSAS